jgi:hypothetical protein
MPLILTLRTMPQLPAMLQLQTQPAVDQKTPGQGVAASSDAARFLQADL